MSYSTDMFGIGCVFLWLLTGIKTPTDGEIISEINSGFFDWREKIDVKGNLNEKAIELIDDIARNLLGSDRIERKAFFGKKEHRGEYIIKWFEDLSSIDFGDPEVHKSLYEVTEIEGIKTRETVTAAKNEIIKNQGTTITAAKIEIIESFKNHQNIAEKIDTDLIQVARNNLRSVVCSLDISYAGNVLEDNDTIQIELLAKISGQNKSIPDYICDCIANESLTHSLICADGGMGKTYSLVLTVKKLLTNNVIYKQKNLIPVIIPARYVNEGIITYLTRIFYKTDNFSSLKNSEEHLKYELRNISSIYHFLVVIDGLDESNTVMTLRQEIFELARAENINLTFIVSCQNVEDLSVYSFKQFSLDPIDTKIREKLISGRAPNKWLELLNTPFYLKTFSEEFKSYQNYLRIGNNIYSLLEHYVERHIIRKYEASSNYTQLQELIDITFPKACYTATKDKKYLIIDATKTNDKENAWLERTGLMLRRDGILYIKSSVYQRYFAAKWIYTTCKNYCEIPKELSEIKDKELDKIGEIIINGIPKYVGEILAPRLLQENVLNELSNDFGKKRKYRDKKELQAALVRLFAMATNTVQGIDFRKRDLWLSDLKEFSEIINCNFEGAKINPETLWLHDTQISYLHRNQAICYGQLVIFWDNNGIEIYNLKDDQKIYINLKEKLTSIKISDSELLIRTENIISSISLADIGYRMFPNTTKIYDIPVEDIMLFSVNTSSLESVLDMEKIEGKCYVLTSEHVIYIYDISSNSNKVVSAIKVDEAGEKMSLLNVEGRLYMTESTSSGEFYIYWVDNEKIARLELGELEETHRWKVFEALQKFDAEHFDTVISNKDGGWEYGNVCYVKCIGTEIFILSKAGDSQYIMYDVEEEEETVIDIPYEVEYIFDINELGDVIFADQRTLYMYKKASLIGNKIIELGEKPVQAQFVEGNNGKEIFVSKNGVYEKINDQNVVNWRKTLLAVIPHFYGLNGANAVFEMTVPGKSTSVYFEGTYGPNETRLVPCRKLSDKTELAIRHKYFGEIEEIGLLEGQDKNENLYYRQLDHSIIVKNKKGEMIAHIFGNIINLTGSKFDGVKIAGMDANDVQKAILRQFGGTIN